MYSFTFQQQTTQKRMFPGWEKHTKYTLLLQEDSINSLIDKLHHIKGRNFFCEARDRLGLLIYAFEMH